MRKLSDEHAKRFDEIPESGMGYHVVEATVEDVKSIYVVVSSKYVLTLEDLRASYSGSVPKATVELDESAFEAERIVKAESDARWEEDDPEVPVVASFALVESQPGVPQSALRSASTVSAQTRSFAIATPKKAAPLSAFSPTLLVRTTTIAPTDFGRFCSARTDRRTSGGYVLAGTYLTPSNDVQFVATGLGACGRYALPNPRPARYRFTVTLGSGVPFLAGTARPLFGQAGGGVEVLLPGGTPASPVTISRLPAF